MAHWGMEDVQACFGDTADLNTRQITVGGQRLRLLFLDGLTSGGDIAEQVLKPLMETVSPGSIQEVLTQAERARVYCAVAERTQDPAQTADKLLHGYCAVIFPGTDTALCFETKTSARRGPSAPESENTVKGAKDAFTETMRINTSLLRRHLRTAQLRFSQKTVGLRTKTAVTVCYLADLTAPELVRRMEKRLENIDIDGMLTPASVEEYVTGSRRTAFPLLQYTERPDTFCQGLLNGQVGLLVDGLPLGYLAPVNLGVLMKSTEDRAVDYLSASCLRVLRYLALLAALLLPGLYVAMATYHQEMIPTKLLLAIIESKREVPFDTVFEVVGLLAAFELLQEAGLHLPQAIGTAVSIIGGLVVGTTAVDARLVSPAALIVTASAGICGFTLPSRDLSDAVRIWRFALAILAGAGGLFALTAGGIALLIHLSGLTSLDVSYLAPFSDARARRAVLRPLLVRQKWRDTALHPQDLKNQGDVMLNKISIALLATASVVSLCMLPRTGTDAAKLLPAQVLVIAQEDGRITVESDNGASGSGTTLPDALAAMREGAEGTLFLDTAEHIILLQSTQSLLPAAVRQRQFRPAAKLYLARMDALDADGCVEFLQAHPGAVTLADAHAALLRGEALDPAILLPGENGGIILAG